MVSRPGPSFERHRTDSSRELGRERRTLRADVFFVGAKAPTPCKPDRKPRELRPAMTGELYVGALHRYQDKLKTGPPEKLRRERSLDESGYYAGFCKPNSIRGWLQ
jgi:hypothetical protein